MIDDILPMIESGHDDLKKMLCNEVEMNYESTMSKKETFKFKMDCDLLKMDDT